MFDLKLKHINELSELSLQATILSLDLSQLNLDGELAHQPFCFLGIDRIKHVFRLIPPQINAVNLSKNGLFILTNERLLDILEALPLTVKTIVIDLHEGYEQIICRDELAWTLDLRLSQGIFVREDSSDGIQLSWYGIALGTVFSGCLSGSVGYDTLERALDDVSYLNLSQQLLGRNFEVLENIFKLLPQSVVHINLSHNGLFQHLDTEKLKALFRLLPVSVTKIDFDREELSTISAEEYNNICDTSSGRRIHDYPVDKPENDVFVPIRKDPSFILRCLVRIGMVTHGLFLLFVGGVCLTPSIASAGVDLIASGFTGAVLPKGHVYSFFTHSEEKKASIDAAQTNQSK